MVSQISHGQPLYQAQTDLSEQNSWEFCNDEDYEKVVKKERLNYNLLICGLVEI